MEEKIDIKEAKKQVEKNKTVTPPEPQKQVELKDVETLKLESLAFRIGEQIKGLQRQYNEVYTELIKRQDVNKNGNN